MEVCGLSIAVGKDGREHILGASDSTLQLMGDSQEDDRRQIADLVSNKMQVSSFNKYVENVYIICFDMFLNFQMMPIIVPRT